MYLIIVIYSFWNQVKKYNKEIIQLFEAELFDVLNIIHQSTCVSNIFKIYRSQNYDSIYLIIFRNFYYNLYYNMTLINSFTNYNNTSVIIK